MTTNDIGNVTTRNRNQTRNPNYFREIDCKNKRVDPQIV